MLMLCFKSPSKTALLLCAAILLPAALWVMGQLYFKPLQGVTLKSGKNVWVCRSAEEALDTSADRTNTTTAKLSAFIWIRQREGMYFILKGFGKRRFFVDGKEIAEMRRMPFGPQFQPISQGMHRLDLIFNPNGPSRDHSLMWTSDLVESESIPTERFYLQSMSKELLYLDLAGQWAGILWRFDFALVVLILLVWGAQWIFQRMGLFIPQHPDPANRLFRVLLLVMLIARLAGIGYQLAEGLHPDERMVDNSVVVIRSGTLEPPQHFWSAGYMYATAATEAAGEWIWNQELPPHLAARFLSAIFSWLTCLVLFSTVRKLFNVSVAIWATLFLGFALMPVELAHQGIVEPTMVFFFLFAFRLLLELNGTKRKAVFALAGFAAGVAVGMKQSAGIILLPAAAVCLSAPWAGLKQSVLKFVVWAAGAVAGFLVLSPYTLLDFDQYMAAQRWQVRSQLGQAGSALFFVGDQSAHAGTIRIIQYLTDGMGLPVSLFAALGCLVVVWKHRARALLILPVAFVYFAVCASSAASPYHYALLLCPFVAMLAAVAVDFISSFFASRKTILTVAGILLLAVPISEVVRLEVILQGTDTRRFAEAWCNRNLLPGTRVDYEMFGPRFLMPFRKGFRVPLLDREPWNRYISENRPTYYVFDDISYSVFADSPQAFPVETEWFKRLRQEGRAIQDFPGDAYRLYNPHVIVYQLDQNAADGRAQEMAQLQTELSNKKAAQQPFATQSQTLRIVHTPRKYRRQLQ